MHMQLQAFLWMILPVLVAGGSALIAYYIMQSRMEVAIAKERETLAKTRAQLQSQKATMEERIKATEEATRRAALDELMREIRVEERSYLRDVNTSEGARRSMVLQERVFFRNIPMSGWSEREMLIEEAPQNALSPRSDSLDPALLSGAMHAAFESSNVTTMPSPAAARLAVSKAPAHSAMAHSAAAHSSIAQTSMAQTSMAQTSMMERSVERTERSVERVVERAVERVVQPMVTNPAPAQAPTPRREHRTLIAAHAAFGVQ